jgi:L-threonylcarbamoyladenylate synthase
LAANALDIEAVTKIFEAKNRPTFDPLIIHTDTLEKVKNFVVDLPEIAQKLAETLASHFWAGALTLLLPKKNIIPDLVTSGMDTVAVRIPAHPLTLALLARLEFPLAAPSANPFGYISPTTAQHVENQLGTKISLILDGGACDIGIESTIIGFEGEKAIIYRLGGISVEEIEKIIGKVEVKTSSSNPKQIQTSTLVGMHAPGMLESHYSPKKPLLLEDCNEIISNLFDVLEKYDNNRIGGLFFSENEPSLSKENQLILSKSGDYAEATKNLFSMMRELDSMDIDVIIAELLPEIGLGRAINDRLRRAAAK